ncbi:YfcC family protein [Formosa haliotis]|uniref:YfcC family protein n=1 Tax=Formosa haliotis TaxID=1555194 RepID=UPI0008245BC1|nr:YfcC family protein [Formosa haliotis]
MKAIKFPTALTVLLIIAAIVAVMTWIIPAGKYERLTYNKDSNTFTQVKKSETLNLAATQKTLDDFNIKIPIEKFKNGDIWKPIGIPDTYYTVASKPQGIMAFIQSPIRGIMEAIDVILFVLIIGGFIGIMNFSGAFEAGISSLAKTLYGREYILIIVITFLIAIGGTTFGLAEETIAFYPILIPVFLAAKYDAMVALACIYIGSCIGTLASTVNPFCTIIASDAAGINWTTGLTTRLIVFFLGLLICLVYIIRYAQKVKNDPSKSIIFDQKEAIEQQFPLKKSDIATTLTAKYKLILTLFTLCFVVMIYGVSQLDWWFLEMTTVFLVGSILIGCIARIKEATFVDTFIKGANDLLGVAFIIGIARGVTVLMEDGLISDSLLFYASTLTDGMNKGIFINAMLYIYSALSFFIPSSSGMAVLTMPIMAPLADGVGIGRDLIVNAYQFGMGIFAFINPTGLILASLAIVKIGFDKWIRFVMPLVGILLIFLMIVLTISVYI